MRRNPKGSREPTVPLDTLNRLAISIIHEVSNPLSIIIGNAQYILLSHGEAASRQTPGEDEIASTVQTILDESMRLAGLVSLLLGFSSKITIEDPSPASARIELERLLTRLKSSWAPEIDLHPKSTDAGADAGA